MQSIEEAIKTAINYETMVRDVYKNSLHKSTDDTGKRIFKVLVKEEQYHIDYLKEKLEELKNSGRITSTDLRTFVPSAKEIEEHSKGLKKSLARKDYSDEILMLNKALEVETKTSDFYREMTETLPEEGKKFFSPFLEIELNHKAIVRMEIEYLEGSGFWMDFQEFDLED